MCLGLKVRQTGTGKAGQGGARRGKAGHDGARQGKAGLSLRFTHFNTCFCREMMLWNISPVHTLPHLLVPRDDALEYLSGSHTSTPE